MFEIQGVESAKEILFMADISGTTLIVPKTGLVSLFYTRKPWRFNLASQNCIFSGIGKYRGIVSKATKQPLPFQKLQQL